MLNLFNRKHDAHIIKLNRDTYSSKFKKIQNKQIKKFSCTRSDLLFIKKYLNVAVENIDCTKVMSKIARSYSDKHGLKDLTKEFTGIDISKNLQSSDFGGELTEKQLQYCAKDVVYLHKIYDGLKKF